MTSPLEHLADLPSADLKAIRETVGMSQQDLADRLGVNVRSVKRWENPLYDYEAPEGAYEVVEDALARQHEVVAYAVNVAEKMDTETPVELTYSRGLTSESRMANANVRLVGFILESRGHEVVYLFKD